MGFSAKEQAVRWGIKQNFGFGMMRLPLIGNDVDIEQTKRMVDAFIKAGFNYFDTAHGYLDKKSELAVRSCLTSRYDRNDYLLTDKLTGTYFKTREEIRPLFERQLAACGVDYFDFYLMHAQTKDLFEKFKRCHAYETAFELKREGKVKHVGLSFHDKPEVLDEILATYPEIELVQIQYNYLDCDDPAICSRACYDVCVKYDKPVVIMEPIRGGSLINLPPEGKKIADDLGVSPANLALRFAASPDHVMMVLSGMSSIAQMEDNLSFMKNFALISDAEREGAAKIAQLIRGQNAIPCTACRYCVAGCPKSIPIPDLFACHNSKKIFHNWNSDYYYSVLTKNKGRAGDCIKCGKCEKECPQHLPVRKYLAEVAEEFEKEEYVDED